MENNYYRITAYHPEKDISIIMDSFGLFEKEMAILSRPYKERFQNSRSVGRFTIYRRQYAAFGSVFRQIYSSRLQNG